MPAPSVPRSAALAAWYPAWVRGTVSLDQVVDAVGVDDAAHRVLGLDRLPHLATSSGHADTDPAADAATLTELLAGWRRAGARLRCVLPVAGDVRGLRGPAAFRAAALDAGEAVLAHTDTGTSGAVPQVVDHAPSSAPTDVTWQITDLGGVDELERLVHGPRTHRGDDVESVTDAQYELATAIRESATSLTRGGVAGTNLGADLSEALSSARRAGEQLVLPPDFPPRAVALLAQAERLHAVLDLAWADPHGGAVDRVGVALRTDTLRPLATAVRRARVAGYNALNLATD